MAATALAPVASAQPMAVAAERGDLALVPYYTVRDQWVTGIHIVNTSDHTQVVKFRFRRATDGMDALDFNVVMSPKDVYAGLLNKHGPNRTIISWSSSDTTCTVPAAQGNRLTLPDIYRVGAESGYVEIIAMGRPINEQQPIAVAAKHVKQSDNTFKPLNCKAVESNFYPDGLARVTNAAGVITTDGRNGVVGNNLTYQPGFTSSNPTVRNGGNNEYVDSGNVLKVSYFIRDKDTGIEFGDNAVHILNLLTVPSITNQQYGLISGDLNGFDFPDLDGTGLPRSAAPGTIQRGRFDLLRNRFVLGVTNIINEWSVNPANGVKLDWVVTLPGQYTMLRLPQYRDSLGPGSQGGPWVPTVGSTGSPVVNPKCPRTAILATTTTVRVDACDFRDQPVELEYVAYNREEFRGEAATGTLVVSPQPPTVTATTYLPKTANVITFGDGTKKGVLGMSDANVNASLGQPYGWLEASLRQRSGNNPQVCSWNQTQDAVFQPTVSQPTLTMTCAPVTSGSGVPVIGFAAWARNVARDPNKSYGRIVEHSYRVLAPGAPTVPTVPGAPTGITVRAGNAQVVVNWTAVTGATRYTVYYSTSPITSLTAAGVTAVRNLTTTSHTVTGLTNGTLYYFVVTAINAGGESAASSEASATPAAPTAVPGAPTNLSATVGSSNQVVLRWTAVPGAVSYTAYYSTSPITSLTASGVTAVANLTTTSHTVIGLTIGTLYYFVVTATTAGGESTASNEASATPVLSIAVS